MVVSIQINARGAHIQPDEFAVDMTTGAKITASSDGAGSAGDISVVADSVRLRDKSRITNDNENDDADAFAAGDEGQQRWKYIYWLGYLKRLK